MDKLIKIAVVGGVVGGIVLGMMMQMMGMIPMVAMMIGSESLFVGWIIHMVISIIFGFSFVLLSKFIENLTLLTIVYGVLIWIVGPLLIMPIALGMGPMIGSAFTPSNLMSLGTHLLFSIILAIIYKVMNNKNTNSSISA